MSGINSVSDAAGAPADLKNRRRKRTAFSNGVGDRLPPHSPEAEQAVLGCVLIEPSCLDECRARFKSAEVFYDLRHQYIYQAMLRINSDTDPLDLISLQQELKRRGHLQECGGLAYLSSLPDATPSAANLGYYLDTVCEKYRLRKLVETCTDIVSRVYEETDLDVLLESAQRDLERVFAPESADPALLPFSIDDLNAFDLVNDPDNLVGNRYITRGGSLLVNGPSGRGKSSLMMFRLMLWAMGRPFYGQKPVRPLSAVIWQAENNLGDLAKPFQDIRDFLELSDFSNEGDFELLRKNLKFFYVPAICGQEFINAALKELANPPPDLAVLDPLVAFTDEEIRDQKGAAAFLRKGLSKISMDTGVAWIVNHHTTKPSRDTRGTSPRLTSNHQYAGAGSFDIAGWARAVETLEEVENGVFRFIMAKRGGHGSCHPDGTPSNMLWLRHAASGKMHWEQCNPPEEPTPSERGSKGGAPNKMQEVMALGLGPIIDSLTEPITKNKFCERIENFAESKGVPVGRATCQKIIAKLYENGAITKNGDGNYVRKQSGQ